MSLTDTCKTPAGTFSNCLKIKEGSAIEIAAVEYKYFAPLIGIKHGFIKNQQAER